MKAQEIKSASGAKKTKLIKEIRILHSEYDNHMRSHGQAAHIKDLKYFCKDA